MNLWLNQFSPSVPPDLACPADLARFELDYAAFSADLHEDPSMGDAYRIEYGSDGVYTLTGGQTGLLYAAYRLIISRFCGENLTFPVSSSPKYALRMID